MAKMYCNANANIIDIIRRNIRTANIFYIPDVIKELIKTHNQSIEHWKNVLLKLEKENIISLQPESGQNRLSKEDKLYSIHLNIAGQDMYLTWATLNK